MPRRTEPREGDQDSARENADARSRAPSDRAPLAPGLHLLATPIGAADDITLRGLAALRGADALAAEDTRTLRKLMDLHGTPLGDRPLIAYHDHNADRAGPKILARLEAGERVLYASDAGTPLIADPGFRLVRAAYEAGAAVHALPGPCAAIVALTLSGLPSDRFAFGGFLPPKPGPRRRALAAWATTPGTLIFYEAPHRLAETLADMAATFGPRPAALARELTKRFEEVRRAPLPTLADAVGADGPPKGEIVVLIGPAAAPEGPDAETLDAALLSALETQRVKDAARTVADMLGTPRKLAYDRAISLIRAREGGPDEEPETS